jgi:fibronectin type 3 domain-containing protein
MMIAVTVAVIVGAGVYAVFNSANKSALSQKMYNDVQTSCGFAMDQMKSELSLAGYRAVDDVSTADDEQQRPVSDPSSSTISFQYYDDNARAEAPYADVQYGKSTLVKYSLVDDGKGRGTYNLQRQMQRFWEPTKRFQTPLTQTLASDIRALSFTYFQNDNSPWSGADKKDIRTVRVSLTCQSGRMDPNTKTYSQVALTTEVRAQNLGVASTPADTTPPAAPTGVAAWDPGDCGTLQLRWNANIEPDLAGYIIFYGAVPGSYSGRITLSRGPKTAGDHEYYTLTSLSMLTRYYIALVAYDKSGNQSGLSTEASGNPTTNTRSEAQIASNGTDSTINPVVPPAPTGFVAATPADNTITLTWPKSPVVGLVGYRLYRGTTPTFAPDDTPVTGNRLAGESTGLDANALTFTDHGTGLPGGMLIGCTTYYYKLTAVACDLTLPAASRSYATASAAPTDGTPPPTPTLMAKAGYKRIILNLQNPVRSGPGATPDFVSTKIWYSKTGYPVLNPSTGVVTGGALVPDSVPYNATTPGVMTRAGTVPPINFNSETNGDPAYTTPELDPGTPADPVTYFFLAVSYDQCGNHSLVTSAAQAEGTQANDCLPTEICYLAPPAPANLKADGCYGYITLSWDAIDPVVYYDLAGFHVWRCDGVTCAVGGTELSGGNPSWFNTWTDSTVSPGQVYSYRIEATDAYYERTGAAANRSESTINNLSIGQLLLDPTVPQVVSGYLLPSTTNLPFTTILADGLSSVPPTFRHDKVTIWLQNTSAGTVTPLSLRATWDNPDPWLLEVAYGDGSTSLVEQGWRETAVPLTHGSGGGTVTLATTSLFSAADTKIPFVTSFLNQDGTDTATTDLRQVELQYTLDYQNDTTHTATCTADYDVFVPLGPFISATTQDLPTPGTNPWAVPGDSGTNALNGVVVPGGTGVTVFTSVNDTSAAGLAAVTLYYYVDTAKTLTAPPALDGTASYPNLAPYTAIALQHLSGDLWVTPAGHLIPESDDQNVWYFIVALDLQGNFDRDPEIDSGAYQYYQQSPDACSTVPSAPVLAGAVAGSSVTLTWSAPTTNATPAGTPYSDAGGYKVYRVRNGGAATLIATVANPATTTYTDANVTGIATYQYTYYVTAYDTCSPSPKESAASNVYAETVEDPCANTPSAPVVKGSTAATSVTLLWQVPQLNSSGSPYADPGGFKIWRQKDNGGWGATPYVTIPSTSVYPANFSFMDNVSDVLTAVYSYKVTAYDACTPTANQSSDSNVYTDDLAPNSCLDTPNPPTGLAGSVDASKNVVLTWVAPTKNTDGTALADLAGYAIFRSRNGGSWTMLPTTVGAGTLTFTDSTVAADVGAAVYSYYVEAFDSCALHGQLSTPSNTWVEGYSDPCLTTPKTPTNLVISAADATGVTLTWTAPTQNTDNSALGDLAGYNVYRCATTGCTPAAPKVNATVVAAATYKDTVTDAGSKVYSYSVSAVDQCAPTADESALFSPPVTENFTDLCNPAPSAPVWTASPTLSTVLTPATCPGTATTTVKLTWPSATATIGTNVQYLVLRCDSGSKNKTCAQADFANAAKTTTLATLATGTLTYTDTPGKALKSTSGSGYVLSYQVQAVNKTCATQSPQPYAVSSIVTPCP